MGVALIDRDEARRIAIRAQLLDADRPAGLLPVVEQLTLLQLDPTAAIAPSADLVAWSRLGGAYRPEHLRQALERDRTLFEYGAMVRPMADLGLHLASMAARAEAESGYGARHREWVRVNEVFRRYVLDLLRERGALLSRDVEDRSVVPWPSSGWTNNRNVTQMLELLAARGEIAIAGRIGRQRLWDLPERVYPAGVTAVPLPEAERLRNERRLRALGIARESLVGEAGDEVAVEGTRGRWRVDPQAVGGPFTGRTALLSPFDRLIHDRRRIQELFGFEYVLEMYVPREKRRWGYFALPVLHRDALVGKVDAKADRKAKVLQVHAVHEDVRFTAELREAVEEELTALAGWLGLTRVAWSG